MGPTDPNRLMSMSASLDPAGTHGGPLVETLVSTRNAMKGKFTWTTMPERLSAQGISWKQYVDYSGLGQLDGVLPYFKAYQTNQALANRAFKPTFPQDFMSDLANGTLPQVSWLLAGVADSEHPGFSGGKNGEVVARQVFEALVSHPTIWQNTALFLTYDENGGFFDHVNPPTPPNGTAGEYLTVATLPSAADGIRGPIGLGFRVPMMVISPFSRGGLLCSDVFDHTSILRFLETRFGVEVPNLSKWRRQATGDLTSAFNFAAAPRTARPTLPQPGPDNCASRTPPTPSGAFPKQETIPATRKKPSGIV
jgi:phospholipase C